MGDGEGRWGRDGVGLGEATGGVGRPEGWNVVCV